MMGSVGDSTFGFLALLRRLLQGYVALWAAEVSAELTPPQFGVLSALADESGIDQRSLGERISVDRSTIADVVNRLARRDLVARARDVNDGRRDVLTLTPDGRKQLGQARIAVDRLRHQAFAALSDEEKVEFVRLLERVVGRIDELRESALAVAGAGHERVGP